MKALTILNAFNAHQYESIPNQFIHLNNRRDLVRIFGEGGKVYAIGNEGIAEGLYLYLYMEDAEQNALLDTLKAEAEKEEALGFISALGEDVAGQPIAVIYCE